MRRRWTGAMMALAWALVWAPTVASSATPAHGCSEALAGAIPARPAAALQSDEFLRRGDAMSAPEREQLIQSELLAGNMPRFLRRLAPVTLNGVLPGGRTVRVTVCVMPDYLAIGSDGDYVLVPMALETALAVGARHGFVLPTRKMVDAIYAQSAVQLTPRPLPASGAMGSTSYFRQHDRLIREQRRAASAQAGALTAGHKKDVVLAARLGRVPQRVAIYGWHQGVGRPIQPLSTVHGLRYVDYSHGVRLVSAVAFVDGVPRPISEVLEDPLLAHALSDEGPIPRLAGWGPAMRPDRWDALAAR